MLLSSATPLNLTGGPAAGGTAYNAGQTIVGVSGGSNADLARILQYANQGARTNGGFSDDDPGDVRTFGPVSANASFSVGGPVLLIVAGVVVWMLLRKSK